MTDHKGVAQVEVNRTQQACASSRNLATTIREALFVGGLNNDLVFILRSSMSSGPATGGQVNE